MNNHQLENYSIDKPIAAKELDAFQRYNFSRRIAETIAGRKNQDSLVFGIFGVWGEGKSSVLNFISRELSANKDILTLTFNPWRYGDENTLIINFLGKVAKLLDSELKTNKEKFGDFIEKYGSIGSFFGADVSKVGKNLANVDLEDLKDRVDDFIDKSGKRLVIFIDDIDRLDKQEIYALFRLVKLTADFKNTTYILSFDQDMVAAAIGDRFGSGDKKAGESFLEKIIQVPLTIPKAQPEALRKFCFQLIDNAINNNKIVLTKEEEERFATQFTTNILSRLSTPRLAVRYGNTLSFSMPLLYKEVNTVDLMLIEALRVFYPNYYTFIKLNPNYFIGSYKAIYNDTFDNKKIESVKKHLDTIENDLHETEKQKIRELLLNLFPILNTVLRDYRVDDNEYEEWYLEKRIASPKYFDRYFSYSVIEGDMSDVELDLLLEFIKQEESIQNITKKVTQLLEKTLVFNFLQKLTTKVYVWDSSRKIAKMLCDISDKLPQQGGIFGSKKFTPFGQAAVYIFKILKTHKNHANVFDFALELMTYPNQFEFAYELNKCFRSGSKEEHQLFSYEQYLELAMVLIQRALKESKGQPIFNFFTEYIPYLTRCWSEIDKTAFNTHVETFLNENYNNIISLIKLYRTTEISLSGTESYIADLNKNDYQYLTSIYDKDYLFERITALHSFEEIQSKRPQWDEEYTDLNMIRQFTKWYLEEKSITAGNEMPEVS